MKVREICDDRRELIDIARFAALVATPAAGTVTLPASGRFALRSTAGATYGTVAASLTGPRPGNIAVPALAPNGANVLDYLEIGTVVTLTAGFDLLVDTGLSVFKKIAGA